MARRARREVLGYAAFLGTAALCLVAAHFGLWFAPFVISLAVCAVRRGRGLVSAVVLGAIAGWALALWFMALANLPVGATARTIAALAGLPPYAGTAIAVTLLLAALHALVGAWLAHAVLPQPLARRRPAAGDPQTGI